MATEPHPDISLIIREVSKMLDALHPEDKTALNEIAENNIDPFKVLISTILSHRTRDEKTKIAVENLFKEYRSAEEIACADIKRLEWLVKPVGFYRVKAKRIKEVSKIIHEKYSGRVPDDLEALLSLPSVGRKTANCVLVYGFRKPAIPVDTHVHRISNRLNMVNTKTPKETEVALTKIVDVKYWMAINDLFVRFGQRICRPIKPRCGICTLSGVCAYYLSSRS